MIDMKQVSEYLKTQNIDFFYKGNDDAKIECFCSLSDLKSNCISWVKPTSYFDFSSPNENESLTIVADISDSLDVAKGLNVISCKNPKAVYFSILNKFFASKPLPSISKLAVVETSNIGKGVSIGHNCYICADTVIGDNVFIHNNVVIECPTFIGNNTIIYSGVVIGTDGYGYYEFEDGIHRKVPHFGGVKIGENVEIGANTCIDRGTMGDTIIMDNSKIDNLCHIGHNASLGENTITIALSLIGGSATVDDNAYIAPGVMVMNQVTVGKDSLLGMGAVVTKNVRENTVVAGVPAKEIRKNK